MFRHLFPLQEPQLPSGSRLGAPSPLLSCVPRAAVCARKLRIPSSCTPSTLCLTLPPRGALALTLPWGLPGYGLQINVLSHGQAPLPPSISHHKPPVPFSQAVAPSLPLTPSPTPNGWLPWASSTPLHTLTSFPPPLASKLWLSCWESSWGQLPLPGSHLRVKRGGFCLAKWGLGPAPSTPGFTLGSASQ